ncbi:MAG: metallophosphoesterase [Clostridia bacterium]|nr:metallophosphoesterase [Clostridia bacterium]
MKTARYTHPMGLSLRIGIAADFHARSGEMHVGDIVKRFADEKPDLILAPGDIFNNTDEHSVRESYNINGLHLLEGLAGTAPVFYSVGNHEHGISGENREILESAGVTVFDNEITQFGGITIAGLTSGYAFDKSHYSTQPVPDLCVLDELKSAPSPKILLCHHPEYWTRYIAGQGIDLTVSGHAHGGQWRIGSRGAYAPGQGIFPKYVSGLYHRDSETLCVSRGMRNTVKIPRFFNPCEIVILDI